MHRASVLLPLLAAVLVAGCSGDGDPRVQTAIVGRATVTEAVDAPGTVSARATAALAAPADATVAEVLVADGATVAKDAVLVRLSSPAAAERLRTARQQLDSAASVHVPVPRADLRPLQESLDAAAAASFAAGRSAAALVTDPVARQRVEQQVAEAEARYAASSAAAHATQSEADAGAEGLEQALAAVTRSQRTSAAAAVSAAQATVDALTVRAPIAGAVTLGAGEPPAGGAEDLSGLVDGLPEALQGQAEAALGGGGGGQGATTTTAGLSVGAAVSSGAPLLTVTDLSGLTVTAEVDETDVLLVAVGTPATVEVDAVPGAEYPAAVQAIDLAPRASSGGGVSYGVRLDLRGGRREDGAAPPPRPGMSAVVDLQVRTAKDVVAVPSAAVVRDTDADVVFVVEAGRAVRRVVRVGAQGEDLVEVTGVEPGARVVVRDADRLRDGQAVRT